MVATNIIYAGDCLNILKGFPENCIDLIYLDPPFFTNKQYEEIWHDKFEKMSFEDRWEGGINHYVEWLKERLEQCHRVLKETGSIYVHLDYHAVYNVKIELDKIFRSGFRGEIIWSNETASGYKTQGNKWIRGHDNILYYVKSKKFTFNKQFRELVEKTIARYDKVDKNGRQYKIYKDADGKERIVYLDKSKGRHLSDVWTDIIAFQTVNRSGENTGYPTQKPLKLLERIIIGSSNKGDVVLDPFCGCGTTLVAAQKQGRKWIGIDISPTACKLMKKRLNEIGVRDVIIQGLPTSVTQLKDLAPFDFQNWVVGQLKGTQSDRKSGDMGIDGYILGTIPIQVKQSEGIGRNVIDNFETAIRRMGKKKGVIVAFSFVKSCYEEVSRARLKDGQDIVLLEVKDLLKPDFQALDLFKD